MKELIQCRCDKNIDLAYGITTLKLIHLMNMLKFFLAYMTKLLNYILY